MDEFRKKVVKSLKVKSEPLKPLERRAGYLLESFSLDGKISKGHAEEIVNEIVFFIKEEAQFDEDKGKIKALVWAKELFDKKIQVCVAVILILIVIVLGLVIVDLGGNIL